MQHPIVGDNKWKKFARSVVKFCEQWWVQQLVRPIFFLFPPMLATTIATRQGLQTEITATLGDKVGAFINNSALLTLIGAYFYVAFLKTLYAGIEHYSKPGKELSVEDILAILEALNVVVGDKSRRIGGEAKSSRSKQSIDPTATFLQITRPDQQIALLVAGLRSVFSYLDEENALFRVGLLKITDGVPDEWVAFSPESHPPRTPANQLSTPTSTVAQAIKSRSVVVVDDIQKELKKRTKDERRFLKGNTQPNEQGSQLCYPVVHSTSGNVEYVITVAANKKECLVERHAELYSWIIDHFVLRISLEHSLLILKEKANGR